MARTFVQQSQISGSLSYDDTLAAGEALAGQQTLVDDLNALRSQINKIIGGSNWYDALSGSQDLADIHAAMQVAGDQADFQGKVTISGELTGSSAVYFESDLAVDGQATFNNTVHVVDAFQADGNVTLGSDSADTITFNAKAASDLDMSGSFTVKGIQQADTAGEALAWGQDASVSDLIVTAGDFTVDASGNVDAAGTLDVGGVAHFDAAVYMADALYVSGALAVDQVADFADDVYMAANLYVSGTLAVAQKADFADIVDVAGTLSASAVKIDSDFDGGDGVGKLYLVGADGEIAEESDLIWTGDMLKVTGSVDISEGLNVASGGLTVAGDRLEVTGSFGLLGNADLVGDLTVSGNVTLGDSSGDIVDVQGTLSASAIKIDGDVAKHLYIVDSDGSIKDEADLWFDGSVLFVTGSVEISEDLEVKGGDITLSNSMSISSATAGKLVLTSDLVEASGDLKVAGNDISGSAGLNITLESAGDVTIAGDLKLMGNELKSSAGSVVLELSNDDAFFKSDVHVAGDLYVKGAMTYIETTNLKVQDAFIHLATGSTGAESSGIVLHGGAGATDDLMLAQDGGAGEFVFAKLAHGAGSNHGDTVDGSNIVPVDGAVLVPAWMSSIKVGGVEGSLSGSFAASAAGAELSSSADLAVTAADDLLLSANSETAISFIESGEQTTFASNFPGANPGEVLSLIGAVNELFDMIGGGSAAKGDLSSTNVAAGVLTFSSIGTLTAAEHKLIDVYLNGVLLSPSRDLSNLTTTTVELDSDIASSLMVDDVITVVIRSAAPTP